MQSKIVYLFSCLLFSWVVDGCNPGHVINSISFCVDENGIAVPDCVDDPTKYSECCDPVPSGHYSVGGPPGVGDSIPCPAGTYGSISGLTSDACTAPCRCGDSVEASCSMLGIFDFPLATALVSTAQLGRPRRLRAPLGHMEHHTGSRPLDARDNAGRRFMWRLVEQLEDMNSASKV